mmetsp:Transcript_6394/g.19393  ORF Transcript_6394/g.19393 Transcript_6394/m.19393 type:complete len:286 (-) Transcript_6394:160-1017(-)
MAARTVLITGASSGFGLMTAKTFALKGWRVIATMRNPEAAASALASLEGVTVLALDVQKPATIDSAVAKTMELFGRIDVLVNNAGYGCIGFFEGTSMEEIERQYEVNVLGSMRVTKAVLPHMRKAKSGTIVNVSSVAGGHTNPLGSIYYSSKWALEGWAECLSYELLALGIQVKLVQPGAFKTDFGGRSLAFNPPPADAEEYKEMLEEVQKRFASGGTSNDPDPVVPDTIYLAATEGDKAKLRYPVFVENDHYGQMYDLRKTQGPEAQYKASVDQNPVVKAAFDA